MRNLTEKQIEILDYISTNGKIGVEVTPRLIKQNGTLYQRVWQLEDMGAIIVDREFGMKSKYTITNVGLDLLNGKC